MPQLPFAPDGRSALTKVLAAMPDEERARARALGGRMWLRNPDAGPRPAVGRVLDEALRQERVVVLDYVDAHGVTTRRRAVEPMALASTGGRWYLLAWCRSRRDGRWFRLDRVAGATLTTEQVGKRSLEATFGAPPDDARPLEL
jgi:predicted DNA-binding transcriptional regulator YafY